MELESELRYEKKKTNRNHRRRGRRRAKPQQVITAQNFLELKKVVSFQPGKTWSPNQIK